MAHIDSHKPGSFSWFELATTDLPAAKAFYTSLFGWDVNDQPIGPSEVYSIFTLEDRDCAAAYSMRQDQRDMGMPPHWLPYVAVKNADVTAADVTTHGGMLVMPPFDVMDAGRMALIQDPAGADLAAWQPNRNPGTRIAGVDNTIGWVELNARGFDKVTAFYRDIFGWQITKGKDMTPADANDYGHIVNDGTDFIGGMTPEAYVDAARPAHWRIYVEVSDCAATVAKAKALGASILVDTTAIGDVGWYAALADPQGATFAIHHRTA